MRGWNWGAFLLTWIWGICNGTLISLLSLLPGVHIIMMFVLGAKGNEWAWRNKNWQSIEQFHKTQKKWAVWGLALFLLGFAVLVIVPFGILGFGISMEWPNMQRMVGQFEEHRRFCNYALSEAERDPRSQSYFGGKISLRGPAEVVSSKDGCTEISIPVGGPGGEGVLYLRTRKGANDEAQLERAELELSGLERLRLRTRVQQEEMIADERKIAKLIAAVRKESTWTKREPKGTAEAEEFYVEAIKRVEADANVRKVFGNDITAQLEHAKIKFEGPCGEVWFRVLISGNGKSGVLTMEGKRAMGSWTSSGGRLQMPGADIEFPPAEIAPGS